MPIVKNVHVISVQSWTYVSPGPEPRKPLNWICIKITLELE